MNMVQSSTARLIAVIFALVPAAGYAFNSGSTGADGAFNPTVSQELQLPPSGIFNFTDVTIPSGVTITFKKNAANTPVVILATGNVTISGTIDVRGTNAPGTGSADGGNLGDDGQPGKGGPGGFDGGVGGKASLSNRYAGSGLGPGGGRGGFFAFPDTCIDHAGWTNGGSGGGYGVNAANSGYNSSQNCTNPPYNYTPIPGGTLYGSALLLPLIGGSGGGGGGGGAAFDGAGGGGGGGAILIAASGTITISFVSTTNQGRILADGGAGGNVSGAQVGGAGGGGSGGGIRLVATTITGEGTITANGGTPGSKTGASQHSNYVASAGAPGRIRLEGDTINRSQPSSPNAVAGQPTAVFLAGAPTLTISSVAGVLAPPVPSGNADITLPASTVNPVTVSFATTNVPQGNTVLLTVTPQNGNPITQRSPAIAPDGSASVSVALPVGPSVLQAQTTYTIVTAMGDALMHFAGNERVKEIEVVAILGGGSSKANLVTVSGKRYPAPEEALRIASLGF